MEHRTDFKVVGREQDGQLIFEDQTGYRYVSGETLDEFGANNLTDNEKQILGVRE